MASHLAFGSRPAISKQFLNSFTMCIANGLCNSVVLTGMMNLIFLVASSFKDVLQSKGNSRIQHEQAETSSRHAMTNTELFSDGRYVFGGLMKCLMLDILIVV